MHEKRRHLHVRAMREQGDNEQKAVEELHLAQSATLLIADGDSKARQLLRDLLTREGFGVIEAGDGAECLRRISQREPELMETPMEGQIVSLLESGADSCVTKPFHHRELVARIRALLRRW